MADTRQIVRWALEYSCALRTGNAATEPDAAAAATDDARYYSDSLRERSSFGVFGDVCVTSITGSESEEKLDYPACGFLVSKAFEAVGGPEALFAMCAGCPANTQPIRIAHCVGILDAALKGQETEDLLRSYLDRENLGERFAAAFLQTTPLWYGLWARSPLSLDAVRILRLLFGEILREARSETSPNPETSRERDRLGRLTDFLGALKRAEEKGILLHVALTPLGHTDFGWYTIFPHCPICKAYARLPRWQNAYPSALYTCQSCGAEYPPAETGSSVRKDFSEPDLREVLGESEFVRFAKQYLVTLGSSESEAIETVAATEKAEREREAKSEERLRRSELQRQFIRQEIFKGLTIRPHPYLTADEDSAPYFDAADFAEVLARCKQRKIKVLMMFHQCKARETEKGWSWTSGKVDPETVFAEWRDAGAAGLFSARFQAPDELLDAFAAKKLGEVEDELGEA